MRRFHFTAGGLASIVAIACGSAGTEVTAAPVSDGGTEPKSIAELVTVDQVAVYQGVKVTLVNEAALTAPNAPVVPSRPALVRIHARTPAREKARVVAELRVHAPGHADVVVVDGPRTLTTFDDSTLGSTFNFELTAEQVSIKATLSVEFRDPTGADPSIARYPAEDEPRLSMNVGPLAPNLKVRFVPIRYQADGSDRVPLLDTATVDAYKDALYKLYPVATIEVSVRDPLNWSLEVQPRGEGWNALLDALLETRKDDNVADDVYYVGIFNPADTEREYCRAGCILGVAPATKGTDVGLRVAMIVGYPSERSHGTLAQELAHAMGRQHAPCGGPAAVDKKYPYSNASVGVWGWNVNARELVDPDGRIFDFMSYCSPVWVSDYTFGAIYDRLVQVDATKRPEDFLGTKTLTKTYRLAKDGSLRPGPMIDVLAAPPAEETFVLENDAHQPFAKVQGSWRSTSGVGGGLLLAPVEIPATTLKKARFARAVTRQK